jgi:DNA-binding transcriptional regulator YbjK
MATISPGRYSKGEARMKEILDATVDIIYEDGISAVTHRSVAKRAGVAASAPSYFFPTIDALVVEAFRSIMASMIVDHETLSLKIISEDMDRATAVDAYIEMVTTTALKYDKLQFEAYLFAASRPALKAEVEAAVKMTWRPHNTLVTASRRDDIGWAAPILTALADGFGLHRIALSNYEGGFLGLKEGLLALMEALPGNPPDWLASDQDVQQRPGRAKSSGVRKK